MWVPLISSDASLIPSKPLTSENSILPVLVARQNVVNGSESRFHNAAGNAEDDARARILTHNVVVGFFVGKLSEINTGTLDEFCEFSGGQNSVNVTNAVNFHFGTGLFVFFRGTWHD